MNPGGFGVRFRPGMILWLRNFGCRCYWGSCFFLGFLESWTTPEIGGVVTGAKCTFCWTFPVLGAFLCKVIRATFNATGGVVAIVLRMTKRLTSMTLRKAVALFVGFFDSHFGIK